MKNQFKINMVNRSRLLLLMPLLLTVLFSCGLERNNPLDPKSNPNVVVPNEVLGIHLQVATANVSPRWIKITWQRDPSVDGYYIYRGMSRHSVFQRIEKVGTNSQVEHFDYDSIVQGKEYWYRMSSYMNYEHSEDPLEGKLTPITETNAIRVN